MGFKSRFKQQQKIYTPCFKIYTFYLLDSSAALENGHNGEQTVESLKLRDKLCL
jgi:hypothetical protein